MKIAHYISKMNTNEKLDAVLNKLLEAYETRIIAHSDGKGTTTFELKTDQRAALQVMTSLMADGVNLDLKEVMMILDQLEHDGYAASWEYSDKAYYITFKGIMLSENGGYEERAKREQVEYDLKKQQLRLNDIELFFKSKTFYIALIGLVIATVSLYYSVKKDDKPKMPERQALSN